MTSTPYPLADPFGAMLDELEQRSAAAAAKTVTIQVEMRESDVRKLDAWIATRPGPVSRERACQIFLQKTIERNC